MGSEMAQTFAKALAQAKQGFSGKAELLESFAKVYFSRIETANTSALSATELAGMVLTHLDLLQEYSGEMPAIRYFPRIWNVTVITARI